jgi:hypothetical protein
MVIRTFGRFTAAEAGDDLLGDRYPGRRLPVQLNDSAELHPATPIAPTSSGANGYSRLYIVSRVQ